MTIPKRVTFALFWLGLIALAAACAGEEQPVDLLAEKPTPTRTPTPFPSRTPTVTPTAVPTATPVPPPTPLPVVMAEISGPRQVPAGLPRAVTWRITLTQGAELVNVAIEDLGGTMLTGSGEGQLVLARALVPAGTQTGGANFDSEWTIEGIIDPNVGQGVFSLHFENATAAESLNMAWQTTEGGVIDIQTATLRLDGVMESTGGLHDPAVASASEARYVSAAGLSFDLPAGWFVQETPDGIIQLSLEPLGLSDGARPAEAAYATVIAGSAEDVGLPSGVTAAAGPILDWLLGDLTTLGGELGGQVVGNELRVVTRETATLPDGSEAETVLLRPIDSDTEVPFQTVFAIVARSPEEIYIVTIFEPVDGELSEALPGLLPTFALAS